PAATQKPTSTVAQVERVQSASEGSPFIQTPEAALNYSDPTEVTQQQPDKKPDAAKSPTPAEAEPRPERKPASQAPPAERAARFESRASVADRRNETSAQTPRLQPRDAQRIPAYPAPLSGMSSLRSRLVRSESSSRGFGKHYELTFNVENDSARQ